MATSASSSAPLVDAHGRVHDYLRIAVTDRCNLRCTYCMPAEGIDWTPRSQILSFEEITRLTRLFARMGVTKVRLTGGEPLVRSGLEHLVAELAAIPGIRKVCITTNGVLLAERLPALRQAGLTHLNISLDTLRPQRFQAITGRPGLEAVRASIAAALEHGYQPLKVNAVVMGGVNDDEILDFVDLIRDQPIDMRFIEFMPFQSNNWQHGTLVPYRRMIEQIEQRYRLIPLAPAEASDVSREFALEGFRGTVGFIASMTDEFCAQCSRVRLTSEGAFKPCLHDGFEVPLRPALRGGASDAQLEAMIRAAVMAKAKQHAPAEELIQLRNRTMIQIGG